MNINQWIESGDTLSAMRRAVEERVASEPRRKYLGASAIGDSCRRKLWYDLNGYPKKPIEYRGCSAIEDGHRTEELIIGRLRMVKGVTIYDKDEAGKQNGFKTKHISGHYDGVIIGILEAPKTYHIFEVKCCNEKKFNELVKLKDTLGEKKALKAWDEKYYAQAVLYMHAEGLTRHYLVCSTPGGREQVSVRTNEDPLYAVELMGKAQDIQEAITADVFPRIGKPDFYLCKFCDFKDICHNG